MTYAIPLFLLILTVAGFFAVGGGRFRNFGLLQILLRLVVAVPLVGSGVFLHFLRYQATAAMIPPVFSARAFLVMITGVLEIVGAVGLFIPKVRQPAAFWIAILMVAVFPANIYVAGQVLDGMRMPSVTVRTMMQIVFILLVLLAGYGWPGRAARSK